METFLGFILGLMTVVWVEWMKRPKLSIVPVATLNSRMRDGVATRFLQVRIANKPARPGVGRIIDREPALGAYARIEFLHLNGAPLINGSMDGRWSGSPEVPTIIRDETVVTLNMLDPLRFRDIFPNRPELLTVAIKLDGDSQCYGFTNLSYLQNYRSEQWRVNLVNILVRVSIFAGSVVESKTFALRNRSFAEFGLEEIVGQPSDLNLSDSSLVT